MKQCFVGMNQVSSSNLEVILTRIVLVHGQRDFQITQHTFSSMRECLKSMNQVLSSTVKATLGGQLVTILLFLVVTWPWLRVYKIICFKCLSLSRHCVTCMNQVGRLKVKVTLEISWLQFCLTGLFLIGYSLTNSVITQKRCLP